MTNSEKTPAYIFASLVGLTTMLYLLRGMGVLGFMPGGTLWILILLSIASGIAYGIYKTRR